jgi:hypothetical protein
MDSYRHPLIYEAFAKEDPRSNTLKTSSSPFIHDQPFSQHVPTLLLTT